MDDDLPKGHFSLPGGIPGVTFFFLWKQICQLLKKRRAALDTFNFDISIPVLSVTRNKFDCN